MQHGEQQSLQELQTGLLNLAMFVAQERLKLLKVEAEELIQSVATASVEEQERIRQIAIKVAISAVSAVVGSVLATVTAGAAHPLLALATTELTKEIAAMNANASLDQMLNFVNEKANAKLSSIASSAVTKGTAYVQDEESNRALAEALIKAKEAEEQAAAKKAADNILSGQGRNIIDDFHAEIRKNPEAVCFVRGRIATFPDTAFKQLEEYRLFVDFDSVLKQAEKFKPGLFENFNEKFSKNFHILNHDRNKIPTRFKIKNQELIQHLENMSKLMDFLKHAENTIPDHPIHAYFKELPGGYENFKSLVDESKSNGINKTQYDNLLKGIHIFQNAFSDKKFYEQINNAVLESNKKQPQEVYPYYYKSGEDRKLPIKYLIEEAGAQRKLTDNFNFENFSTYVDNVLRKHQKTQYSAIESMEKLGYVTCLTSDADLAPNIEKLRTKFLAMTEAIAGVNEVGHAYSRWIDLDTKKKLSHLDDNETLEYAALMTQMINAVNFAKDGHQAPREPYLLTSKSAIPDSVSLVMRAEVDQCAQIAERVSAEKALAARIEAERRATAKPPEPPTLADAVKDLESVNEKLMEKHASKMKELASCDKKKDAVKIAEIKANININLDLMKFMLDQTRAKIPQENTDQQSVEKIKALTKKYEDLQQEQSRNKKQSRGKIFSMKIFNRNKSDEYSEKRGRSLKDEQPEPTEKKQSVINRIFRKG